MAFGIGPQGYQGLTGRQGARGFQGDRGHQGRQGFQGLTGRGSQGYQGVAGTGSQGFQGVAGSQGFQGVAGSQGSQGAGGSQGFQGAAGAQGSQGFQGLTGSQGSQGAAGSQGSQGFQGLTGSQGSQGAAGTGSQGAQGAQGATGTGSQGSQGAQGAAGGGGSGGSSAYQYAYTYSSTTSAAGIATGTIRLSHATLSAVGNIYIHVTDANSRTLTTMLPCLTTGSTLTIRENSTDNYGVFMVQAVMNNGTYLALSVDPTTVSGSFTAGDSLTIEIAPTGQSTTDVAYISDNGSDATGAVGCPTRPYASMAIAQSTGARAFHFLGMSNDAGVSLGSSMEITITSSSTSALNITALGVSAPNTLTVTHLGPPENVYIATCSSVANNTMGGTLDLRNVSVQNVSAYGQISGGESAGYNGGVIYMRGCLLSSATVSVAASNASGTAGQAGGSGGSIYMQDCRYTGNNLVYATGGSGAPHLTLGYTGGAGGPGGHIQAVNIAANVPVSGYLNFFVHGGGGGNGGPGDEYGAGSGAGGAGGTGGTIHCESVLYDSFAVSDVSIYAYGGGAGLDGVGGQGQTGGNGGVVVCNRSTLNNVLAGVGDCNGGSAIPPGSMLFSYCRILGSCYFQADTLEPAPITAYYTQFAGTISSGGSITRAGYYVVESGATYDAWT